LFCALSVEAEVLFGVVVFCMHITCITNATDVLAHTKCARYTVRTSDDLAKGHNLLYFCDPCLEFAHEMRSFMRQSKSCLRGVINSFGVARDSFRRADELLSALNSQFNGLKL